MATTIQSAFKLEPDSYTHSTNKQTTEQQKKRDWWKNRICSSDFRRTIACGFARILCSFPRGVSRIYAIVMSELSLFLLARCLLWLIRTRSVVRAYGVPLTTSVDWVFVCSFPQAQKCNIMSHCFFFLLFMTDQMILCCVFCVCWVRPK